MVNRQAARTWLTNSISMAVLVAVGWLVYREAIRTQAPIAAPPAAAPERATGSPAAAAHPVRAQPDSELRSDIAPPPHRESAPPARAQATTERAGDREELNRLRLRLAELERERDTALAEAAKFEQALQRAVTEMNAQESRHRTNLASSVARVAASARYSQANAEPWISVYGVRAEVLADRIIVFGDVRNIGGSGGPPGAGQRIARVRLFEDGREIESQQLPIEIGLHTDVPIQATFYRTPMLGMIYSARIDVES